MNGSSGTLRRECLNFLIPFGVDHLRRILRVWGGALQSGSAPEQSRPGPSRGTTWPTRTPAQRPSAPTEGANRGATDLGWAPS